MALPTTRPYGSRQTTVLTQQAVEAALARLLGVLIRCVLGIASTRLHHASDACRLCRPQMDCGSVKHLYLKVTTSAPALRHQGSRLASTATCSLHNSYAGGIREPGILEWPAMINQHRETTFPAYVSDYLPTFLDVVGLSHEQPSWAADGISLLPFIKLTQKQASVDVIVNRTKPLGFQLGISCRNLHSPCLHTMQDSA
eukprot:SAG31_NODE_13834_length_843_cov_1.384409_1_plen_199_part_00